MLTLLMAVSSKTLLLILMVVLGVLLVLMTVLGIVFIVALRKRAPVIKVVMAPPSQNASEPEEEEDDEPAREPETSAAEQLTMEGLPAEESKPAEAPKPAPEPEPEEDGDDDDVSFVTEGKDRVHYDRSFMAKIIQLKDDSKEWYTQVKNELLSYQKVKSRISWKRETFRLGRNTVARFVVRGKTLCLLLAVEPSGFTGTKYTVEDVSSTASMEDTPCLFRIKSARRAKYAKEMIDAVMKELAIRKDPNFEAQDYYVAYEGTMGLMNRGLIKRVVTNSSRTFEVREVNAGEVGAAPAEANEAAPAEEVAAANDGAANADDSAE